MSSTKALSYPKEDFVAMRTQDMLVSEDDIRVAGLRQRMDEFYCSIANYDDFAEPNS